MRGMLAHVPALAVVGVLGCAAAELRIADPDAALPAKEDSAAFLDRVAAQREVTENDAMHGFLMLGGAEDTAGTFRRRVETLLPRKIVDAGWDFDADRPITRGRLAYMVYQTCKLPAGVILSLTGPSQRYCLRELQYRNMMGTGSTFSAVGGMEFVSVLSRADICLRTGKVPDRAGEVE